MRRIGLLLIVMACGSLEAERQPYSRYESIVNRQMFGARPDGFDPTRPPSEVSSSRASRKAEQELSDEQQKIKSAIHFSMINVTPSGETAVGFTDGSAKIPINYYLRVGETRNGWTVKEADPAKGTMTIAKDEVEVSLSIGDNSAKGDGRTSASSSNATKPVNRARTLRALRREREKATQVSFDNLIKKVEQQNALLAAEQKRREEEKASQEAEREAHKDELMNLMNQVRQEHSARVHASEAANAETSEPQANQVTDE